MPYEQHQHCFKTLNRVRMPRAVSRALWRFVGLPLLPSPVPVGVT